MRTFACSSPRRSIFSRSATRRPVERDPERGDLVRSRDGHRLREVALGHAPGGVLHPPEGPRHPPAHEEPDHHGHADGEDGAAGNGAADQRPRLVDVVGREREPEHRARPPLALERHRDVQEVAADGRAPADVAADLAGQRPADLRAAGVILDLADGLAVGFGQDGAVGGDDGHPGPEDPRVALGAPLEAGRAGRAVEQGREGVVEQARLGDERPLEPRDGLRLERAADVDAHHEDAQPGHHPEKDGESRGETEAAPRRPVRHHVSPSNR